eukprot:1139045-Pelagomonas_calceolata.AAC.1
MDGVLCLLRNTWCEEEEKDEEEEEKGARLNWYKEQSEFEGCAAPTYHHWAEVALPMSELTKPAPRGLLLIINHSSSNIVAFSFHAGDDDMIFAA